MALWQGQNAERLGRYDWARHYFRVYLDHQPGSVEAQKAYLNALSKGDEANYTAAINLSEAYLKQVPSDQAIMRLRAKLLLSLGQTQAGFEQIQHLQAGSEKELLLAGYWQSTQLEQALKHFQASGEQRSLGAIELGVGLWQQANNHQAALDLVAKGLDAHPLAPRLFYLKAVSQKKLGFNQEAQQSLVVFETLLLFQKKKTAAMLSPKQKLEQFEAIQPSLNDQKMPVRLFKAELQWRANQRSEAGKTLVDIAEKVDELDQSLFLKVITQAIAQQRYPLAKQLLGNVLGKDPDQLWATMKLAEVLTRQGKIEEAKEVLAVALVDNPNDARLNFSLANLHKLNGALKEANHYYQKALTLAPYHAAYRIELIRFLLTQGQTRQAKELASASLEQSPEWQAFMAQQNTWMN